MTWTAAETGYIKRWEKAGANLGRCVSHAMQSKPDPMWISWTMVSGGASMGRKLSETALTPGTK